MKKILLLLILAALVQVNGYSQDLRLGVKAGLNANPSSLNNGGDVIESLSNPASFHFGAFIRMDLPMGLYLQPEAIFENSTSRYYASTNDVFKQRINQFNVPVLLGIHVSVLRLNAGPVFKFKISDKIITETGNNNVSARLKNKGVGYQVGAGIDLFDCLALDVRYQGNFDATKDTFTIGNVIDDMTTSLQQRSVLISVGYMF